MTIDDYLAGLPEDQREALQSLRETIRSAAPDAVEGFAWGMPAFRLGVVLVGFCAFKNHCSFFPMSAQTIEDFRGELAEFSLSKGTIRFTPDKPIPADVVRRMVASRAEAIGAKAAAKSRRS